VSNVGPGTGTANITRLGADSKTGPIWSSAKVDLRDRAHIYGALHTSATLTRGNNVLIDGGTVTGPVGAKINILSSFPTLTVRTTTPITITSGQDARLLPGSYASVTVRPGGTLSLDPDYYSFANVIVESGGKIVTKTDCSPTTLQARTGFTFRGSVLREGGTEGGLGLLVRYEGSTTAPIESRFRGAIVAPNAEINMAAVAHEGRFFAKAVRLQSGASVTASAQAATCSTVTVPPVSPSVSPADIGSAPPLVSAADLDTFLAWFYRIRKAELSEAKLAISRVGNRNDVFTAVATRFETAKDNSHFGEAVMLLSFLGAMALPAAERYLGDLVAGPVPALPDVSGPGVTFSRFDREIAYRQKAIAVLASLGTESAAGVVRSVALNHPVQALRGYALGALVYRDSSVREELRGLVRAEDQHYMDQPRRSDPDFGTKLETYRTKYAQP